MAERPGERLPRGRHALPHAEVVEAQRGRMMSAMAEAMMDKGYVGTTVADVIAGAGVSRETFYQRFGSKLDCFMSSFEAASEVLFARLAERSGVDATLDLDHSTSSPIARFDRLFGEYLETLAIEPAYARVFLVEVYAAGPDAIARRVELQSAIADSLATMLEIDTDHGRFACQALVAAVSALVTGPLVAGDLDALRSLREPVVDLVERALALSPSPSDRDRR